MLNSSKSNTHNTVLDNPRQCVYHNSERGDIMQPRAVIYCSKHGATKEYAQCLGKKKNLPVISIDHISGYSFQNIPVYFCGWIRNGKIMGLNKASKLFMCVQVIGVGAIEYNEAYELKLKYKNGIVNPNFKYVQSIRNLSLTTLEKMYVDVFQPSLMGKNRGETHEYSI
ncbi:hypothetical protein [Holdemanella porci]|uniref:hypothetical protein n=2 Tax=Erysipelotrichaceae TaxID=128827 RepID=UPI003AF00514